MQKHCVPSLIWQNYSTTNNHFIPNFQVFIKTCSFSCLSFFLKFPGFLGLILFPIYTSFSCYSWFFKFFFRVTATLSKFFQFLIGFYSFKMNIQQTTSGNIKWSKINRNIKIPEELDVIIYNNKVLENFGNDLKELQKKHIKKNTKIRNNSYGIS